MAFRLRFGKNEPAYAEGRTLINRARDKGSRCIFTSMFFLNNFYRADVPYPSLRFKLSSSDLYILNCEIFHEPDPRHLRRIYGCA